MSLESTAMKTVLNTQKPGFDLMMQIGTTLCEFYKILGTEKSVFDVKPTDETDTNPLEFEVATAWGKFFVTKTGEGDVWCGALPNPDNEHERVSFSHHTQLHVMLHISLVTMLDAAIRQHVMDRHTPSSSTLN